MCFSRWSIRKKCDCISMDKGKPTRYSNFNRFIHENNLIDLGFVGNPYTWRNKREKQVAILSHLDCTRANYLRIKAHPHSIVRHLLPFCFDRAPILLETHTPTNINNLYRFRFEGKLLLNKDRLALVKPIWFNYIKRSYAYHLTKKTYLLK